MNTTSLPFALNRSGDFRLPADGWIQLAAYGEVPAPLMVRDGDEMREVGIVQVINREVAEAIVAKFNAEAKQPNFPGLLVDYDHFSHDTGKSTRAAGWIEQVEARADGLWGKVRFSAGGKAALEGGDYRMFSPVLGFAVREYHEGERVSPVALLRGALTNDPRFKGMVPISNRQDSPAANEKQNKTMDYKSVLIGLLGLAAAATDAEIQAAVEGKKTETENRKSDLAAAQNRAATAEARATTAEAALLEHDLDAAALNGEARNAAKVILAKNRAEGLAFLKAIKPAAESGYHVTHNRETAKSPRGDDAAEVGRRRDAAVRSYLSTNRCDFESAWNSVRISNPDLFKE